MSAASARPFAQATSPLRLSLQDAILMALEHNPQLRVQRHDPRIASEQVVATEAVFIPVVEGRLQTSVDGYNFGFSEKARVTELELGIRQQLWTGTSWRATLATGVSEDSWSESHHTRVGLSIHQALLRDFGSTVGLADLRLARLDLESSVFELRGYAEALVLRVQRAYWRLALDSDGLELVEESMRLAERQLQEAQEIVDAGRMAAIELVAAKAERSFRREDLIDARSRLEASRLRLLQILGAAEGPGFQRSVELLDRPFVPDEALEEVDLHLALAQRLRSDLSQARIGVERGNVELVKTRNGLLPRLDFFVVLGGTGYADAFSQTINDRNGHDYHVALGVEFSSPLSNRGRHADHRGAQWRREQAAEALANMKSLVELDVRLSHLEVIRARQQIDASAASVRLQEESLQAEREKFTSGRSTGLAVAQAQRDLLATRQTALAAIIAYLDALDVLAYADGSILTRRGITTP